MVLGIPPSIDYDDYVDLVEGINPRIIHEGFKQEVREDFLKQLLTELLKYYPINTPVSTATTFPRTKKTRGGNRLLRTAINWAKEGIEKGSEWLNGWINFIDWNNFSQQ